MATLRLATFLLVSFSLQAVTIPTLAGIFSIAASSGTIVKEGHDFLTHPIKTLKRHGKQIKEAAKGKKS